MLKWKAVLKEYLKMIGSNLTFLLTGVDWIKLGILVHEYSQKVFCPRYNKNLFHKMAAEIIWQNAKNILRITFFFTAFLTNIFGLFVFHAFTSLSLRCVHRKSYRRVQRFFEALFVRLLLSLIQVIAPNELVICIPDSENYTNTELTLKKFSKLFLGCGLVSESEPPFSRDLVMSNHQIYSDWIYLWALMDRIDRAGELKIIMKRSLRSVPIFGWSMRFFDFVFLNRKWEQDQAHFTKKLRGFVESNYPFCLLIFPEGTTLTHESLIKSESFAAKLGVKPTSRVLLPRVLGMWEAVKALDSSLDGIYDITVGYSGIQETDEPEKVFTLEKLFYCGITPEQVHYHLSYIPLKDIPRESADEFAEWLREKYYEKDRLLDEFYRTGKFPHSRKITKKLCPRYYLLQTFIELLVSIPTLFALAWIYYNYVHKSILTALFWFFSLLASLFQSK